MEERAGRGQRERSGVRRGAGRGEGEKKRAVWRECTLCTRRRCVPIRILPISHFNLLLFKFANCKQMGEMVKTTFFFFITHKPNSHRTDG